MDCLELFVCGLVGWVLVLFSDLGLWCGYLAKPCLFVGCGSYCACWFCSLGIPAYALCLCLMLAGCF